MPSTRLDHILFLDIETVPLKREFRDLDERAQKLFEQKSAYLKKEGISTEKLYKDKAGIWAEFGKVICICIGYFKDGQGRGLITRSFSSHREKELLEEFRLFLDRCFNREWHLLCAHNGKEFDFPYLARRMICCGISLPGILDTMGKKPWQVKHLDTMELWKFGDYKHYTSLDLLCHLLGLPGSKSDLDGSQVARVYYQEQDLDRIIRYCSADLLALVQVYLRMTGRENFLSELL